MSDNNEYPKGKFWILAPGGRAALVKAMSEISNFRHDLRQLKDEVQKSSVDRSAIEFKLNSIEAGLQAVEHQLESSMTSEEWWKAFKQLVYLLSSQQRFRFQLLFG